MGYIHVLIKFILMRVERCDASIAGPTPGRKGPAKPWERDLRTAAKTTTDTENLTKPWENPVNMQGKSTNPVSHGTQQALRPWEKGGTGYSTTNAHRPYSYPSSDSYLSRPYSLGMNGNNYNYNLHGGYGMFNNAGMYGTTYGPYSNLGGYQDSLYGRQYLGHFSPMGGPPGGYMSPYNPDGVEKHGGYPSAWQAMLGGIGGIVHFFGRLSFLVDENAHAIHFFMTALLQLLERVGFLYGELARFVLRILGLRIKSGHGPKQQL